MQDTDQINRILGNPTLLAGYLRRARQLLAQETDYEIPGAVAHRLGATEYHVEMLADLLDVASRPDERKARSVNAELTTQAGTTNATLTISVPLDASEADQQEVTRLAGKCAKPGSHAEVDEPYVPGADTFTVRIDRDSELGRVLWD